MKSVRSWKQQQQRCNCSFCFAALCSQAQDLDASFWMIERDELGNIFHYFLYFGIQCVFCGFD